MAYNLYGGVLGFAPTTFLNRGNNLGDLTNVQQALYNLGFGFDANTATWTLMGTTVGVASTSSTSGGGTNIVINEMLSNSNINTTTCSQTSSQSNVNGGGGSGSGTTYTSTTPLVCKDITANGGISALSANLSGVLTANGVVTNGTITASDNITSTADIHGLNYYTPSSVLASPGANVSFWSLIGANNGYPQIALSSVTDASVNAVPGIELLTDNMPIHLGYNTNVTGTLSATGNISTTSSVTGTTGIFSALQPSTSLTPLTIGGNNSITIQLLDNVGGIIISSAGTSINSYTGTTTITGNLVANNNIRGSSMTCANNISAGSVTCTNSLSAGSVTCTNSLSAGSVTCANSLSAGSVTCTNSLTAVSVTCTNSLSAGVTNVTDLIANSISTYGAISCGTALNVGGAVNAGTDVFASGTASSTYLSVYDTGIQTTATATIPYGISQPKVPKWSFNAINYVAQSSSGFANYSSFTNTIYNQTTLYGLTNNTGLTTSGVSITTGGAGTYFVSCQISATTPSNFTFGHYTGANVLIKETLFISGSVGSWQGMVYLPSGYKTGVYWTAGAGFTYVQMSFSGYRISQE